MLRYRIWYLRLNVNGTYSILDCAYQNTKLPIFFKDLPIVAVNLTLAMLLLLFKPTSELGSIA